VIIASHVETQKGSISDLSGIQVGSIWSDSESEIVSCQGTLL